MDTFSNHKLCKSCKKKKSLNHFHKDEKLKNGCKNECKDCISNKNKKYYKSKNKNDDEYELEKANILIEINETCQKLTSCDDPDDVGLLSVNLQELTKKYHDKLLEKNMCSSFNIIDKKQDIDFIKGKIQEFMIGKKIMLKPDEIEIEKIPQIIKISLPTSVKLTPEERVEIIKRLNI